ncbi:M56 family metallopeptidase [Thalassobellus sediminis]|uniref:M56 family metallopeptidase n=1 Tax=Thalassobellus sediminis TaxID=3367753 RepID=UPI003789B31B
MLHYIIQTVAFQLFFLLIYDVFLKKETFFNWNRIYLIITSILSIALPFIKINRFKNVVPQEYIISLPEVVIGQSPLNTNNAVLLDTVIINNDVSYWGIAFYIGVAIALSVFLYKLIRISVLIFKNPKTYQKGLTLVKLINSNAAFSFFRYVFLGDFIKSEDRASILKHETVHVKHLHSLDLLFFEILRVLFWFNPLVYMYQNRINTLHEFIADAEAVKHQDKSQYYQNLLSQVFETQKISFINPFFKQSLIKKRIVMLTKSKSKQIHLLKYALLIPMVFGMLVYTSCEKENEINSVEELDLSEYKYVSKTAFLLNYDEGNSDKLALERAKESRINQENFLKSNLGYVVWIDDNTKAREFTYSLHSESEKVPDGYSLMYAISEDGFKYKVFGHNEFHINGGETNQNEIDVPFSVIEQVPVFPGCENMSNAEQKKCMSKSISRFVNINFNTELATKLNLKGRQRINVIFKIDREGNITGVRSRAPHPSLEEEAIRVIKTLPKMIPGKQKGKTVNVPYSLPIIFQVSD